ncbi:MAG: NAD(P)H-binding protein [Burkholderiaceae bacterium]
MDSTQSVLMVGATGAVGSCAARALAGATGLVLTLLGRQPLTPLPAGEAVLVEQHGFDWFDPASYEARLGGHHTAICTLGVGQPSKMSRDEFVRIEKTALLHFATHCREAGIGHFQLLSSVGADARSASFYLRTKGEVEDGLRALGFARLSLFQPSMILTPTNRYGLLQGVTLLVWPWLNPLLPGPLRKLRGVPVETLVGRSPPMCLPAG